MAKSNKKNTKPEAKADDLAGTGAEATQSLPPVTEQQPEPESQPAEDEVKADPTKVHSEAEARELLSTKYPGIQGADKFSLVAEDKNVWTQENEGTAVNYCRNRKLKLFRVTWD
jgi:hypothetical protein